MKESQEPDVPAPEVKIRMPNLKGLRVVIDRMKQIDDSLSLSATSAGTPYFFSSPHALCWAHSIRTECVDFAGDLCFQVQTDLATIKTFYKNLAIRKPQSAGIDLMRVRLGWC